jgi:type IV pilus assembly protein PilO
MPDLKRTRNRLKIVIGALALVDAAAIALLVSPLAGMQDSRQQALKQLWVQVKSRQSAPWRGLERKLPRAKEQIDDFYRQRFPSQESAIDADLGRLASQNGVRVFGMKWSLKETPIEGLERVELAANLSGDYLQLVRFINALERNKLFFLVDDVELGSEQNGIVGLQIRLETYLRSGS